MGRGRLGEKGDNPKERVIAKPGKEKVHFKLTFTGGAIEMNGMGTFRK